MTYVVWGLGQRKLWGNAREGGMGTHEAKSFRELGLRAADGHVLTRVLDRREFERAPSSGEDFVRVVTDE